jgi:hypothetical protein
MSLSTQAINLLFGRPLATSEERAEHIGPLAGIPVFGLDALSSAAYGPEAALTLLLPLSLMGVKYIVPVSAAIVALLIIVYFSYRQTIDAYPPAVAPTPWPHKIWVRVRACWPLPP